MCEICGILVLRSSHEHGPYVCLEGSGPDEVFHGFYGQSQGPHKDRSHASSDVHPLMYSLMG